MCGDQVACVYIPGTASSACLSTLKSNWKLNLLTVVPVSSEELVEADEVGATSEVRTFTNEDLFDEWEGVDYDARCVSQSDTVDVSIYFGESC